MKRALAMMVLGTGVLAAACAPKPEGAPAPTPEASASPTPEAALASTPASMAGRWGVTEAACSPDNAPKDGVIEIAAAAVSMGLDDCTVKTSAPEGAGVHLVVQCKSGEGAADYERDFSFSSPGPDALRWTKEGGDVEDYVRCK